jgi:hypothetical protein
VGKCQYFGGICCLQLEGGTVSQVGKSTKMQDREYKAMNKPVGGVQPDTYSVTIKSIGTY